MKITSPLDSVFAGSHSRSRSSVVPRKSWQQARRVRADLTRTVVCHLLVNNDVIVCDIGLFCYFVVVVMTRGGNRLIDSPHRLEMSSRRPAEMRRGPSST